MSDAKKDETKVAKKKVARLSDVTEAAAEVVNPQVIDPAPAKPERGPMREAVEQSAVADLDLGEQADAPAEVKEEAEEAADATAPAHLLSDLAEGDRDQAEGFAQKAPEEVAVAEVHQSDRVGEGTVVVEAGPRTGGLVDLGEARLGMGQTERISGPDFNPPAKSSAYKADASGYMLDVRPAESKFTKPMGPQGVQKGTQRVVGDVIQSDMPVGSGPGGLAFSDTREAKEAVQVHDPMDKGERGKLAHAQTLQADSVGPGTVVAVENPSLHSGRVLSDERTELAVEDGPAERPLVDAGEASVGMGPVGRVGGTVVDPSTGTLMSDKRADLVREDASKVNEVRDDARRKAAAHQTADTAVGRDSG